MDIERVRDLNANECRKVGHKSKFVEKVRVQKGEGKLCQLRMAGAKLIEFAGNFTCGSSSAW